MDSLRESSELEVGCMMAGGLRSEDVIVCELGGGERSELETGSTMVGLE